MMNAMQNIDFGNPFIGCIAIGIVVTLAVALQLLTNKLIAVERFEAIHEVGGVYMSAVGTLYSVVLGMILVNASEKYTDARRYVVQESQALIQMYSGADQMPISHRSAIKESIKQYVDGVIGDEWELLSQGKSHKNTRILFKKIWKNIESIEPITENQKIIYEYMISSFIAAEEARRERVNFSNYKITSIEWFTMIAGGFVNIAFTLFFSVRNSFAQSLMTAMVGFMVAINLYAVFLLGDPFSATREVPIDQFIFLQSYIAEGGGV
jgi:Protein of unknown function (DUF4239)